MGKNKCNRMCLVCSRKGAEATMARVEQVRIEYRSDDVRKGKQRTDPTGFLQILHKDLASR